MMMQVISRAVGLHKLILLNFYPYIQRYIQVLIIDSSKTFCGFEVSAYPALEFLSSSYFSSQDAW